MLTCRQATQLLSEQQDRHLVMKERSYLLIHLSVCQSCRRFGKHMQLLRQYSKAFKHYD